MADKAHTETDEKLEQMERHLSAIYSRAEKDIGKAWKEYLTESGKEIEDLQKAYDDAKKSGDRAAIKKAGYNLSKAKQQRTLHDKRFRDLSKQTAEQLLHVNETALAYINGELPEVYSLGYNALEPAVENLGGYSFTLTDPDTVRNLATSDASLLPTKVMDARKDTAWNTKKLNAEVLQGILLGESMDKIAGRLSKVEDMNATAAIRNARTMVTGAENKGRQDSYERATKDGVVMKREWISTNDGRTRHSHRLLDGQIAEVDKPFNSELGEIMFPGDPHAHPANVYNCRCTLVAKIVGFAKKAAKKVEEFKSFTEEQYNEWQEKHSTQKTIIEAFDQKYGKDHNVKRDSYGWFDDDAYIEEEGRTLQDIFDEINNAYRRTLNEQGRIGYVQDADGSKMINAYLRSGRKKEAIDRFIGSRLTGKKREAVINRNISEVKEAISAMNKMIESTTIDEDIVVDRWAGIDALEKMGVYSGKHGATSRIGHAFTTDGVDVDEVVGKTRHELIGATIVDDGFMSASAQSDLNVFRGSDIKFKIKVPSGTHAYITDNTMESEVVFAPGTKQIIEGAEIIETEAIDYEGKKVKRKAIEITAKIVK